MPLQRKLNKRLQGSSIEFFCFKYDKIPCGISFKYHGGLFIYSNKKTTDTQKVSVIFGGEQGIRWALPIVCYANTRLCSASPRGFESLFTYSNKKTTDTPKGICYFWRRARDSNPRNGFGRLHDFQSCSFDQLGQLSICSKNLLIKFCTSFKVPCYYN